VRDDNATDGLVPTKISREDELDVFAFVIHAIRGPTAIALFPLVITGAQPRQVGTGQGNGRTAGCVCPTGGGKITCGNSGLFRWRAERGDEEKRASREREDECEED
jgi:hypothetical protein